MLRPGEVTKCLIRVPPDQDHQERIKQKKGNHQPSIITSPGIAAHKLLKPAFLAALRIDQSYHINLKLPDKFQGRFSLEHIILFC